MSELIEVKRIGEVERIVHGSGLWDGTGPVEFSNDGETWRDTWAPIDGHPHPEYARVAVYRKEVRIPTAVTIRWDEQVPRADEFWAAKWENAPMRHFGRTVRMVAFRQTFRELLGDIVLEDEDRADRVTVETEPGARNFATEIAEATTVEQIDAIDKAARKERAFTPDAAGTALHRALRTRRRELSTENIVAAVEDSWMPAEDARAAAGLTPPPRPQPKDYLPPVNRAARRANARKNGGKR